MADNTPAQANKSVAKEKLQTIMEAASALTALGDEESPEKDIASTSVKTPTKRFIPCHKKENSALTFPEKLMLLMKFADEQENENGDKPYCIGWLADGKSFVIRNPDEFTRTVLPKFFKATKFSSFTRKLYRWGFRQVNRGIGPDDPIVFGNEHFQRDNEEEMSKMRSITAASSRKAEAQTMYGGGANKRAMVLEGMEGPEQKRVFLDRLLQQKAASLVVNNPNIYGGLAAPSGAVSLTSALRPSLGLGVQQNHFNGGLPSNVMAHPQMARQHGGFMGSYMTPHQPPHQQYPNSSTADIVNAAISALRFAS